MDLSGIFDAIGQFFDNPIIQFGIRAIAVYVVVLWLAAAYWAFRDLQLRTNNPVAPYLAAALIIVFTPVFFLLGVIVYRIIRPGERIGDVNERQLAEEALLAEVEAIRTCPGCRRRVHEEWIICPSCRTRLNRVCPNCGKLVGLDWSLCAWCGKDFERREPVAVPAVGAPEPRPILPIGPTPGPAGEPAKSAAARSTRSARGSSPRAASPMTAPDALPER